MTLAIISLILIVSNSQIVTSASSSGPITNTTQKLPAFKFSNPPPVCPVFSNTRNLNNNPSETGRSEVAAVKNNVYLIYKETSNNVDYPLFFKRSTNGGFSFGSAIKLAEDIDYSPHITAVGNNVYVVWQSFSPQGIFFVRSTDGGASFEQPIKLGNNPEEANAPKIIADANSGVYVAWREFIPGEIFFRRSIDGGKSFGNTINLSNNADESDDPNLAISKDGQNVYVVWHDKTTQSGFQDVFFRRSSNGGASFGGTVNLSNNVGISLFPKVVSASSGIVTNDNVYVVWRDSTPGNDEILYKRSINGGTSFSNTIDLSNDASDSWSPTVAAYGDNHVYIAWTAYQTGEILYKRSINGGTSFGNTLNLSNNPSQYVYAIIAVSSNNDVNVLWLDYSPGNENVFFRKSGSGGAGFGCKINLSNTVGVKSHSGLAIASGGNNIYTTWIDDTTGNRDAYFRTSPPPSPVIVTNVP